MDIHTNTRSWLHSLLCVCVYSAGPKNHVTVTLALVQKNDKKVLVNSVRIFLRAVSNDLSDISRSDDKANDDRSTVAGT